MTAVEYRSYSIRCDDPACRNRYSGVSGTPRAVVRSIAGRDGWTHVRSVSGRKYDKDYCPEHKPDGAS